MEVDAVARSVMALERAGRPARDITLSRRFGVSPADLWDAVTNPQRLAEWFLPVSGSLKPGGRYRFEGNAGGTVTACDPPRRVAVTWEFGEGVSWVELRIAPDGGDALLTLSHICPVDDHWKTYGAGAAGVGWDLALCGLAMHLSQAGAVRFDETGAEGRAFILAASEAWRRAALAGGEDAEDATGAARRSAAFYTGETPPEG